MRGKLSIPLNITFLLCLLSTAVYAQKIDPEIKSRLDSFQRALQPVAFQLFNGENDEARNKAGEQLSSGLKAALELPGAFYFNFDSLENVSQLTSEDKEVKVLSWTIPLSDGTYKYSGFVLRQPKKGATEVFELHDRPLPSEEAERQELGPEEWYGALYYQLIDVKKKRLKYYTLLGWKGNNPLTTKKVIDVLSFDKKGKAVFGKAVFSFPDKRDKYRIIFEFSAEVSMSVYYDEPNQTLIMDHLFPSQPSLEGHYEFYGPDLSFDAFELEKGEWQYREDYDPGNRPPKKEIQLKKQQRLYGNEK